jgi:hypothetical protein
MIQEISTFASCARVSIPGGVADLQRQPPFGTGLTLTSMTLKKQTASDSLHPPVVHAGVPTGGESRGFFDTMKTLTDNVVIKLLRIEVEHSKKVEKLEEALGTEHSNLHLDLIDLVLDVLGIPVDNTCETNACEIANTTGVWPENAYCRDDWYEQWYDIKSGKSKVTIEEFPSWAREQLKGGQGGR